MTEHSIVIHTPAGDGSEYGPLIAQARALFIVDQESHELGQRLYAGLATAKRAVIALWEAPKHAAHVAARTITQREGQMLAPIDLTMRDLSARMSAHEVDARREAAEERRRLEVLARVAEEERRLEEAIAAEAEGETEAAAAILDDVGPAPIIRVEPALARVEGVSARTTWHAELTDKLALVQHVAANPHLVHLLEVYMPAANAMARAQREAMSIPGLVAVSETVRAVSR